jgi:hypothetical protein
LRLYLAVTGSWQSCNDFLELVEGYEQRFSLPFPEEAQYSVMAFKRLEVNLAQAKECSVSRMLLGVSEIQPDGVAPDFV